MSAPVETYRGVEIERTVDVLGFAPSAHERFCISVREREEDSAPLLDSYATVEAAREAIDDALADAA